MNVIYIRTSTEEQNPQNQLKDCQSINKWGEYKLYEEQKSAWKEDHKRTEWNKILEQIKAKEVEHLIVWDLDRIYRNRQKLIDFFTICKVYKTKIHSFRQQWLEQLNDIPSPFNEMMTDLMIQIMGWLAEEESQKKSERIKASMRTRKGKTYSYKGNKWGRKRLPLQTRKRVLALHAEGKTIRQIQEEVRQYKKGNAKQLSVGVIHKIIKNEKTPSKETAGQDE